MPTVNKADFGNIRESEGLKTLRVFVRNDGSSRNAILKVRPTCGCTAADFQQEPIAPGDSAWIDLTYDPSRRPGRFEKAVKIYPLEGEMTRLPIEGVVFSSPETVESMYPIDAGLLNLTERTLMTLSPLSTEVRTLWIDDYNSGDSPVWIRLESDSEAVSSQPFPSPVMPGERGMIGVYIDPALEHRTGQIEYTLHLYLSDKPLAEGTPLPEPFIIKVFTEK